MTRELDVTEGPATKAFEAIPDDWMNALGEAASTAVLELIDRRVAEARARETVFPPAADVFAALRLTRFASVRAVILGQDPYHRPGQAHGLAFSVPYGCAPLPPSLRNIRAELLSDVGLPSQPSGSLVPWARHGVLLLNSVLTVESGKAGSHSGWGWEQFTDAVIKAVNDQPGPTAFLLWGRAARTKARLVDRNRHVVHEAGHPSPLSYRHFKGRAGFAEVNGALVARGFAPIDWSLDEDDST